VPTWFVPEEWPHAEAYAIFVRKETGRDYWIVLYDEGMEEAYFIVNHGYD